MNINEKLDALIQEKSNTTQIDWSGLDIEEIPAAIAQLSQLNDLNIEDNLLEATPSTKTPRYV